MSNSLYHLPGIPRVKNYISPISAPPFLKFPSLTVESLEVTIKHILNARNNYLENFTINEIISAIDTVAKKWLKDKFKWRKEALEKLSRINCFSKEVIKNGIDDLFSALLKTSLKELVIAETSKQPLLDRFCRISQRTVLRAYGPSLIFHICSGNIPGIAVRSLVYGMLVKSANFIKLSGDEAILAPLFVKSLEEIYPDLAKSIAVTWWPGGEESLEKILFDASDHVVVYGSDVTIESVKRRIPLNVKLHSHGHRFSLVVIGKAKLIPENLINLSNGIAEDICKYDQKGCFSPQVVYIEKNGKVSPLEFARSLGDALDEMSKTFPDGNISQEEGAKIAQLRLFYTVKSGNEAQTFVLQSDKGGKWTVVLDEDFNAVSHSTYRFVAVKPIRDLMQLSEILSPFKGKISTVGFAVEEERKDDIASMLGELGAFRFTPVGMMQLTPHHWYHDGRFNILDFLNFVELEQ